mmetsp:Transcript_18518/g.28354  ORF Transcript_18518/g.28354 Transcript_18518/m.28354 type:complete len:210 (+) Transcript_18518:702-1331(+)
MFARISSALPAAPLTRLLAQASMTELKLLTLGFTSTFPAACRASICRNISSARVASPLEAQALSTELKDMVSGETWWFPRECCSVISWSISSAREAATSSPDFAQPSIAILYIAVVATAPSLPPSNSSMTLFSRRSTTSAAFRDRRLAHPAMTLPTSSTRTRVRRPGGVPSIRRVARSSQERSRSSWEEEGRTHGGREEEVDVTEQSVE